MGLWQKRGSRRELSSGHDWGSGYPSDSVTISYLKKSSDYIFGYPNTVRFSWSTALSKVNELCAPVIYADEPKGRDAQQKLFSIKYLTPSLLF